MSYSFCNSQNLVPNPSFEDTLGCPNNIGQLWKAKFWRDACYPANIESCLLHSCNSTAFGVPINGYGIQNARTGNAYAGMNIFEVFYPNTSRAFPQVQLIEALTPGGKYLVTFYVSAADKYQYAISTIGAYFSVDSMTAIDSSSFIGLIPQVENPFGHSLRDTLGWMKVSDTLVANGGERFMTIGNFRLASMCDTVFQPSGLMGYDHALYYLDDVSVVMLDTTTISINNSTLEQETIISIFPNPFLNQLKIDCHNFLGVEIILYDITSRKILQQNFHSSISLNTTELSKGIYLYEIRGQNGEVSKGKIVKE